MRSECVPSAGSKGQCHGLEGGTTNVANVSCLEPHHVARGAVAIATGEDVTDRVASREGELGCPVSMHPNHLQTQACHGEQRVVGKRLAGVGGTEVNMMGAAVVPAEAGSVHLMTQHTNDHIMLLLLVHCVLQRRLRRNGDCGGGSTRAQAAAQ